MIKKKNIYMKAKKGSVGFILGSTWHQIGQNFSNESRWSIIIHYKKWWIKPSTNYINCGKKIFNILKEYPYSSETMCQEYLEIFKDMISNREKLISSRIESFQANSISKVFYSFFRSLI